MDFSIFGYQFMQNAIFTGILGGIACSIVGVFVVLLHMPFIGVAMSHSAFAGAMLGLWLGFDPLLGAFLMSLLAAAIVGPLADRGELNPETSVGIIFSLIIDSIAEFETSISLFSIIISFTVAGAVGVAFGTFPAKRAAEVNPIEALHYE